MLVASIALFAVFFSQNVLAKAIAPSRAVLSRRQETPVEPARPDSTACKDIIAYASAQEIHLFWAVDVFECLKNIPFDPAVANRFIEYYNQTLQFQSTLSLLANPPEGYQQPAVDVMQGLENIKANITAGYYKNQYVFEADVQLLINRMHDGHVSLNAGAMSPFTYASPYGLVSASEDGKSAPKIFLVDDVLESRYEDWRPSAIEKINGVDVVEYLTRFGELNSDGYLEPHADWNAMMDSPVQDIQGYLSVFQRATFYPGDELNFTFANGTTLPTYWWALYDEYEATGPLTTTGDYYNYFVLGFVPEEFDPANPTAWWSEEYNATLLDDDTQQGDTLNTDAPDFGCSDSVSWCNASYGAYPPDPVVVQPDLGEFGAGVVSGYILDDQSTGVLSIPTFDQDGNDTISFAATINDFINKTKSEDVSKIIIDLQQNSGGKILLALNTFKQFFYGLKPYTGSRMRNHELGNVLGAAYTEWWESLEHEFAGDIANNSDTSENFDYRFYAGSEWVITNRINPETERSFGSWAEYYGEGSNEFSKVQTYNMSDRIFDISMFEYLPRAFVDPLTDVATRAWAPEDVVILTDGLCGSACAMFVELMTHHGGVRTVVVGGRPINGPMQSASGTRGASEYDADSLDEDWQQLNETLHNEEAYAQWPDRDDTGIFINYAYFNIRDQMREGEDTPLQFKYNAAQCRIYYTLDNIYNMTRLWKDAAAATWGDKSLCVEGSTGYASTPEKKEVEVKSPPNRESQAPAFDIDSINEINFLVNSTGGLDGLKGEKKTHLTTASKLIKCSTESQCKSPLKCVSVPAKCPNGGYVWKIDQPRFCMPPCSTGGSKCNCKGSKRSESKYNIPTAMTRAATTGRGINNMKDGYCQPSNGYVRAASYPEVNKACAANRYTLDGSY